jgi:regulatory protein
VDAQSVITDLRPGPRGTRRRRVFADDDHLRTTSVDVVRELDLQVGLTVDPGELIDRISELEPGLARARGLDLLSYRDRSRAALERRLVDDGYPEDVASAAVADLSELGLLDDARLADSLAERLGESELLACEGVRRELERRGIPDELAAQAAQRHCPPELSDSRAQELALRLARPSDDARRLAARIHRRGYPHDVAWRAARHALA